MKAALDAAVRAHAAAMPEGARRLLEPLISVDAKDGWLRDALMAYLRYFVRVFEDDEPRAAAESALAGELCAVVGRAPTGDDDADVTASEAELAKASWTEAIASLEAAPRRTSAPTSGPGPTIVGSASRCRRESSRR